MLQSTMDNVQSIIMLQALCLLLLLLALLLSLLSLLILLLGIKTNRGTTNFATLFGWSSDQGSKVETYIVVKMIKWGRSMHQMVL